MKVFVLDNSVTMRWFFENTANVYAESVLENLKTGKALVPVLWRYEVSAVLAKSQAKGFIAGSKVDGFLAMLRSLNIVVDLDGTDRILADVHRIAVTHGLTSYDAAYLELAMRKRISLATLDVDLINACKASGEALLSTRVRD